MTARTIHIETELPTDADRVWSAMTNAASFLYVTCGALGFPALVGRTDPIEVGELGSGWLFALHVIPVHRHTIEIVEVDERTRSIVSNEHGGVVDRWDHTLHVDPIDDARCRYSDIVVIDAGILTPVVCAIAIGFYHYRQRRWLRLVRKHLLPSGPTQERPLA